MLKTKLKNLEFNTPFINASGCLCRGKNELNQLISSKYKNDAVISKSSTIYHRDGNESPRYKEYSNLSINSMGLPNNGIFYYLNYFENSKVNPKKRFISLSGMTLDENIIMLEKCYSYYNTNKCIHGVEINLSCPNIKGKSQIGYDFDTMITYLTKIFNSITKFEEKNKTQQKKLLIGIKLPPYFDIVHFEIVANILSKFDRLDFITCINSIGNGLMIDTDTESVVIKPKNGFGGIGGSVVKPTALANVHKFYQLLGDKIDIIGCGGITNGEDVFQHILAGASMVSIGTELMKQGPIIFNHLNEQLNSIMKKKGYNSIEDFRGKLNYL
jgi:dihydroorotate dehydrogenase (fumarate)